MQHKKKYYYYYYRREGGGDYYINTYIHLNSLIINIIREMIFVISPLIIIS